MSSAVSDPRILRGMQLQLTLRQERLRRGERPLGWKLGFGAPPSLQRLGLDAPLAGFLTGRVLLESGAALSVASWIRPALEPEIAVYIARDLAAGSNREAARAAIGFIGPAIELADVDYPPEDVETILAGNIFNRHVILGRRDPSRAGCVLDGLEARISQGRDEIACTSELQAQTGDILAVLCHLADLLCAMGEGLRRGELVIMGSIIPALWIESAGEIRYHLDPIDMISVNLQT